MPLQLFLGPTEEAESQALQLKAEKDAEIAQLKGRSDKAEARADKAEADTLQLKASPARIQADAAQTKARADKGDLIHF